MKELRAKAAAGRQDRATVAQHEAGPPFALAHDAGNAYAGVRLAGNHIIQRIPPLPLRPARDKAETAARMRLGNSVVSSAHFRN